MYIMTVHLYSLIVAKERGLKQADAELRGKQMLLYVSVNIIWWRFVKKLQWRSRAYQGKFYFLQLD